LLCIDFHSLVSNWLCLQELKRSSYGLTRFRPTIIAHRIELKHVKQPLALVLVCRCVGVGSFEGVEGQVQGLLINS